MLNMKKKNAITLLALVLTIVILLLLAAIAIQMTLGENGLIAKSTQAQKEQAKAELYDTEKQSYTRLSLQAVENKMPKPDVEEVLTTEEFTAKYNVVGGNITDKKGTVIDTKEAVLDMLKIKYIVPTSELEEEVEEATPSTPTPTPTPEETTPIPTPTPEETTPVAPWSKTVAGFTIAEEDRYKTILKFRVLGEKAKIKFYGTFKIDYGDGTTRTLTGSSSNSSEVKEFNRGEYVFKIAEYDNTCKFHLEDDEENGEFEVEVIYWGDIGKNTFLDIEHISKIYEPEPDKIFVAYIKAKFSEIPEWLFEKKVTATLSSAFWHCDNIRSIPENLFEKCINVKEFRTTFYDCRNITSIPENLFKHNVNVTHFNRTFDSCGGLTSIPENLFKYNVNVTSFRETFDHCDNITSIPEKLFKYNVNAIEFNKTFSDLDSITSIPENLFKYNVNATDFTGVFRGCYSIRSIPENLFKYNVNAINFKTAFMLCTYLASIPENLFQYNTKSEIFYETFSHCPSLSIIPNKIIEYAKANGRKATGMFYNSDRASNYNSLPDYMKHS